MCKKSVFYRTRRCVAVWIVLLFMGTYQLAVASPRTALTHSAVAVPDQFAADTANAIFAKGGNAVDAAVAVAFSLAVT